MSERSCAVMARVPRVSILIPNFNNGVASSRSGSRDFIGDLLNSLHETLLTEPVEFEILAHDDGSTDDSLDTLRTWSRKTWRGGAPFLTLTEDTHCGILARTANGLTRAARGEIVVRLDGDIICLTPRWVSRICALFDAATPAVGIIVPKQLNTLGFVHEFGDFLIDPRGYRHNAHGQARDAVKGVMEVDLPMGCFFAHRKCVWEMIGGYDETFLRGQTVDFGLRSLMAGYRCWATADVEYIHAHAERKNRETAADSVEGIRRGLGVFETKWGFSRLFPDTESMMGVLRGTRAMWNPRIAALAARLAAGPVRTASADEIAGAEQEWARYAGDASSRGSIDVPLGVLRDCARQAGTRVERVLHVGCGGGLAGHLVARGGIGYVGIDISPGAIEVAHRLTASQTYGPAGAPRFEHLSSWRDLPVETATFDAALITWTFETHPNPMRLWSEIRRALKPSGLLVIFSRRARGMDDGAQAGEHRYSASQLAAQMRSAGGFNLVIDLKKDDVSREIVLVAQRVACPGETMGRTSGAAGRIPQVA